MLEKLLASFGPRTINAPEETETRRRHARRAGTRLKVTVGQRNYDAQDWSLGGLFLQGNDSGLAPGDRVQITMQFDLPNDTIVISHQGRIVRSAKRGVAAEFMPLTDDVRRGFDKVIDNLHSLSFTESQSRRA